MGMSASMRTRIKGTRFCKGWVSIAVDCHGERRLYQNALQPIHTELGYKNVCVIGLKRCHLMKMCGDEIPVEMECVEVAPHEFLQRGDAQVSCWNLPSATGGDATRRLTPIKPF